MNNKNILQIISVLLLVIFSQSAVAISGKDWRKLGSLLAEHSYFKANYIQTEIRGDDPWARDVRTGTIWMQAPDKFRVQVEPPYQEVLIYDSVSIWHYDVELEQVIEHNKDQVLEQSPLLWLLQGLDTWRDDWDLLSHDHDRSYNDFTLRQKSSAEIPIELDLAFEESQLAKVEVRGLASGAMTVTLSGYDYSEADSDLFIFKPEPGVTVIHATHDHDNQ